MPREQVLKTLNKYFSKHQEDTANVLTQLNGGDPPEPYTHQEFPKMMYHPDSTDHTKQHRIVSNPTDQAEAEADDWSTSHPDAKKNTKKK